MSIPKQVYYAHAVNTYNTLQEAWDISTLTKLGFTVMNPNQPVHDVGYKASGMEYFYNRLDNCDALAFRALPGGAIPAGINKEIAYMRMRNKPVFELPNWIGRHILSVEDTREYLREIGHR